jgi:dUTPase
MKLFIKQVEGLKLPSQANEGEDAAYDIVATTPPMIQGSFIERPMDKMKLYRRVVYVEYGTNLFIAPEPEYSKRVVGASVDLGNLTGLKWENVGVSYHTQLWPRSSISKYNLVLANSIGLVDAGYRNQIFLRFKYLFQPEDMVVIQEDMLRVYGVVNNDALYQLGDKVVQIKAAPNVPIVFETVSELPPSVRGLGGFGSSGR